MHMDSQESLRNPLIQPTSYMTSKHLPEQPHLFPHQETIPFSPIQNALFQFQYPTVCMVHLPAQQPPWWQAHFPHPFAQPPQKSYGKPSFQTEIHSSYPLEHVAGNTGKKPAEYAHTKEQTYPCYSGASGLHPKNLLPKFPSDQSSKSTETPSEQVLQEDFARQMLGLCSPSREQWFLFGSKHTYHLMEVSCTQAFLRYLGRIALPLSYAKSMRI